MKQLAGAVILNQNEILLMRRNKEGDEYWVIPGGSVEGAESLEQACFREIKEETGLEIEIERLAFQIENRSREESYFLAHKTGGILQIGEPEKSRAMALNRYSLEWIDPQTLENLDIRPDEVKLELLKLFTS